MGIEKVICEPCARRPEVRSWQRHEEQCTPVEAARQPGHKDFLGEAKFAAASAAPALARSRASSPLADGRLLSVILCDA